MEALRGLVIPFLNLSDAAEEQWERECQGPLVELLAARTEGQTALIGDPKLDIDRQVFVRAEVVDDRPALFAVDHVGIEPAATG